MKSFRIPYIGPVSRRSLSSRETRIFCGHDMAHFLDVARLAYLFNLEENLKLEKEEIYTAALLHDVGRFVQYEDGTPHQLASLPHRQKNLSGPAWLYGRRESTYSESH